MDLSTRYMGFEVPHPLMPGASPLVDNLDHVRRLEDAGAAMIVMHSLFQEQITLEELAIAGAVETPKYSYAEALTYFPEPEAFQLGPDRYLEQIRSIKEAVSVPVIASLNGTTLGGWLKYAKLIEQAGADGLELNLYEVAADFVETSQQLEQRLLDIVASVKKSVQIPLAVKLSPFFSSLGNFAHRLSELGIDGIVLFNRLYQPDLDIEQLEATRRLQLSDSSELPLRLQWLALLFGRIQTPLAISGGVHTVVDVIKAVMAGASGVQMVSALLRRGPEHLTSLRSELARWLEEHEYESLEQMRGSMSLRHCSNPTAYLRANYAKILQTWEPDWQWRS
jgi:dihydroorotate dehydrogenase (fumarate)